MVSDMKKKVILLLLMIFPFNVFAYSDYIIPGGKSIGIDIKNDGVVVTGFYRLKNGVNKNNLKVGDIIKKVNDIPVESIDDLVNTVSSEVKDNMVNFTIKRNGKLEVIPFEMVYENDNYKTGLYVKDGVSGIGTLSYVDPESKIFGALGHEIIIGDTGALIEVKRGTIFKSSVTSIDKSIKGVPGTKNAKFYSKNVYGNVVKNTNKGIYGIYSDDVTNMETLKVGKFADIKLGTAYIYTVISDDEIKKYEIDIDDKKTGSIKNLHFKIVSDELINKTGGIVQGMSGSPIVQNGMIIGAVTHVIVDNPITGYGILITNMLEEGER